MNLGDSLKTQDSLCNAFLMKDKQDTLQIKNFTILKNQNKSEKQKLLEEIQFYQN